MADLVIVIVNYNTRELLRGCLASLRASVSPPTLRVIVVDNCSRDDSAAMVRSAFPEVEIIEAERNGGFAYGNNVGLRAAGFGADAPAAALPRHVLLLNPDTVVPPSALRVMVDYLDAHPDVGAVGPKVVREDGTLDKACRRSFPTPEVSFYRLTGLGKLFPRSRRFARYNLTYLDVDALAEVDALVGAFMLMCGAALQQAGLLDEAFFMYGEDLDLCYRIKQAGWRIIYNPAVTLLHIKGAASRKTSRRAIIAFYDAMRIFHHKHYRATSSPLVNVAVDAGVWLLRETALLRDRLRPAARKRVASA
jgi:hypothetical protein